MQNFCSSCGRQLYQDGCREINLCDCCGTWLCYDCFNKEFHREDLEKHYDDIPLGKDEEDAV